MLMMDKDKAVIVGPAETVVKELAFLMDKLCIDKTAGDQASYEDKQEMILNEVKRFRRERDRGIVRTHPNENYEDNNYRKDKVTPSEDKGPTQAELALEEAMKEIKRMKKAKKKAKAKSKKAKKD